MELCALTPAMIPSPPPEMCLYRYTTQPLRNLRCNPYIRDFLSTLCVVSFGPTQEPVSIQWFFIRSNTTTVTHLRGTVPKYSIVTLRFANRITSDLTVEELTDTDIGTYYCQVQFQNGSLAEPSQKLEFSNPGVYKDRQLGPCAFEDRTEQSRLCALSTAVTPSPPGPTVLVTMEPDFSAGEGGLLGVVIWGSVGGVLGAVFITATVAMAVICGCRVCMKKRRVNYHSRYEAGLIDEDDSCLDDDVSL